LEAAHLVSLSKTLGNVESLLGCYDLFPNGPAQSACKWAGVPKPTGCV
jgi:sulfur relay (sulfurtransferase) DsrC/TusE family protein